MIMPRVAFIGHNDRPMTCNYRLMATQFAEIMQGVEGIEVVQFDTYDASKNYLAAAKDASRYIVFFTADKCDPVASYAAAQQSNAKVLVFSDAYLPGAKDALPDDQKPETVRAPNLYALGTVSAEPLQRLLA